MKLIAPVVFTLAFSAAGTVAANSASLTSIKGGVMVNQGKQFVPGQSGQGVVAGDRIMVMQDGGAVLRFADGCDVTLEAGSVVTVPEVSTCAGGQLNASRLANNAPAGATGGGAWIIAGVGAIGVAVMLNEGTISP
jgi:hypothetical protein